MSKTKPVIKQEDMNEINHISFQEAGEWFAQTEWVADTPWAGYIDKKRVTTKRTLSFQEALEFVNDIVEACVDDDIGTYTPEGFDIAWRIGTLTKYGNFTMPESIESAYSVLYDTPVFNYIIDEINTSQLTVLTKAASDKIDHRLSLHVSTAATKINELIAKMDEIVNAGNGIFSGVDSEQVGKLMENIASMESVDEMAIARAFVKEVAKPEKPKKHSSRKSAKAPAARPDNIVILDKENG